MFASRHRIASYVAFSFAALLLGQHGARAAGEPNPFSAPASPDVAAVAPASVFITDGAKQAYPLFKPMALTIKSSAWREANEVKQVRLFRLGDKDTPVRYGFFGDCDVFLTTVLDHPSLSNDHGQYTLQLPGLSRPFLEIARDRSAMTAARWMLVFETSTSERGDVFRIRQSHEAKYFEGGWIFTLSADKPTYARSEIDEAAKAQSITDDLLKELDVHDKSRPCHVVTMTRVADGQERRELVACEDLGDGAAINLF